MKTNFRFPLGLAAAAIISGCNARSPSPPLPESVETTVEPSTEPSTQPPLDQGDPPGDISDLAPVHTRPAGHFLEGPRVPPTSLDPFGVTQLYPSKPGGSTWFLPSNPSADPRFDPQNTLTANADGSWKMRSSQARMLVYAATSTPALVYDRQLLAARGYMGAPSDFRNVEMTGFVRVNAASNPTEDLTWYARGGRHTDPRRCEGSAYKGSLRFNGQVRVQKESWHVSYDQAPWATATSSLFGRWIGFKTVMRNVVVGGATAVRLELWLSPNADRTAWTKAYEWVDSGGWGGAAKICGGNIDAMPITWGGPLATFRWDSAEDVDFKWLSVREIS